MTDNTTQKDTSTKTVQEPKQEKPVQEETGCCGGSCGCQCC